MGGFSPFDFGGWKWLAEAVAVFVLAAAMYAIACAAWQVFKWLVHLAG